MSGDGHLRRPRLGCADRGASGALSEGRHCPGYCCVLAAVRSDLDSRRRHIHECAIYEPHMRGRLLSRVGDWVLAPTRGDETDPRVRWTSLMQSRRVLLKTQPLIIPHTHLQVFCLGSCFALEIKKPLKAMNFHVSPWDYDLRVALPDGGVFRSDGQHAVLYNTFTIRQEFEKAFGLWTQSAGPDIPTSMRTASCSTPCRHKRGQS